MYSSYSVSILPMLSKQSIREQIAALRKRAASQSEVRISVVFCPHEEGELCACRKGWPPGGSVIRVRAKPSPDSPRTNTEQR